MGGGGGGRCTAIFAASLKGFSNSLPSHSITVGNYASASTWEVLVLLELWLLLYDGGGDRRRGSPVSVLLPPLLELDPDLVLVPRQVLDKLLRWLA